jgi:hypothetical protein
LSVLGENYVRNMLTDGSIEGWERFRLWHPGQIQRGEPAMGVDLFGVGPQLRDRALRERWPDVALRRGRTRAPRAPNGGFAVEDTEEALRHAPAAAEVKAPYTFNPQRLDNQIDPQRIAERWVQWAQGQGSQTVAQWIRDHHIHPNWGDPAWVRTHGARAFRDNRLVVVLSRGGTVDVVGHARGLTRRQRVLRPMPDEMAELAEDIHLHGRR